MLRNLFSREEESLRDMASMIDSKAAFESRALAVEVEQVVVGNLILSKCRHPC